jgi:predicted nucleic acid-binding protein
LRAECRRLIDRCVIRAQTEKPAAVCQAFDIIFGLLERLDGGREDVVFFADEGGAWQVGIDWRTVLPAWFKVVEAMRLPDFLNRDPADELIVATARVHKLTLLTTDTKLKGYAHAHVHYFKPKPAP